jgi:antitoxin component YwqK of YwqJK toxin-antitoxin module
MTFYKNGEHCSYMGHWKEGKHHGYGKVRYTNGDVKTGLFENGKFVGATYEEGDITTYNWSDPRAQEIDFERYVITNDGESVKHFNIP